MKELKESLTVYDQNKGFTRMIVDPSVVGIARQIVNEESIDIVTALNTLIENKPEKDRASYLVFSAVLSHLIGINDPILVFQVLKKLKDRNILDIVIIEAIKKHANVLQLFTVASELEDLSKESFDLLCMTSYPVKFISAQFYENHDFSSAYELRKTFRYDIAILRQLMKIPERKVSTFVKKAKISFIQTCTSLLPHVLFSRNIIDEKSKQNLIGPENSKIKQLVNIFCKFDDTFLSNDNLKFILSCKGDVELFAMGLWYLNDAGILTDKNKDILFNEKKQLKSLVDIMRILTQNRILKDSFSALTSNRRLYSLICYESFWSHFENINILNQFMVATLVELAEKSKKDKNWDWVQPYLKNILHCAIFSIPHNNIMDNKKAALIETESQVMRSSIVNTLHQYEATKGWGRSLVGQPAINELKKLTQEQLGDLLLVFNCFCNNKPNPEQESYKVFKVVFQSLGFSHPEPFFRVLDYFKKQNKDNDTDLKNVIYSVLRHPDREELITAADFLLSENLLSIKIFYTLFYFIDPKFITSILLQAAPYSSRVNEFSEHMVGILCILQENNIFNKANFGFILDHKDHELVYKYLFYLSTRGLLTEQKFEKIKQSTLSDITSKLESLGLFKVYAYVPPVKERVEPSNKIR